MDWIVSLLSLEIVGLNSSRKDNDSNFTMKLTAMEEVAMEETATEGTPT